MLTATLIVPRLNSKIPRFVIKTPNFIGIFTFPRLVISWYSAKLNFLIPASYNVATTSCKSTWDTVPYFGVNGLSMILCLWSPLHPLSKLLAIQDHTQNLEEQLWMGGRREVSIIFYRPVTRSDLKQERSFFRGSVSSFLQLVVARANWELDIILFFDGSQHFEIPIRLTIWRSRRPH